MYTMEPLQFMVVSGHVWLAAWPIIQQIHWVFSSSLIFSLLHSDPGSFCALSEADALRLQILRPGSWYMKTLWERDDQIPLWIFAAFGSIWTYCSDFNSSIQHGYVWRTTISVLQNIWLLLSAAHCHHVSSALLPCCPWCHINPVVLPD